jgi:curved DNA-binding protein CbpA
MYSKTGDGNMLQSQGTRLFDPYRTLQLQPHASPDLVADVYWVLVSRAKSQLTEGVASASRHMGELNDAYALLMDDAARHDYDEVSGYAGAGAPRVRLVKTNNGIMGSGLEAQVADASDHYRLLGVDPQADAEIITVAYRAMLRAASGPSLRSECLRSLLTDAYATISNPQLRAQYDETLHPHRFVPVVAPPPPSAPVPVDAPPDDERVDNVVPIRADVVPIAAEPESVDVNAPVEPQPPRRGGLFSRRAQVEREPKRAPRPSKKDERARIETAQRDRLLSLREQATDTLEQDEGEPLVLEPTPVGARRPSLIVSHEDGSERTVILQEEPMSIGGSIDADIFLRGSAVDPLHAFIWRHGRDYAFRTTDGAPARVNGDVLALPLIFLEDGDLIEIAGCQLRFREPIASAQS